MMPGSFANDRFLGVNPMFGNQFSSRFPYGGGGGRGFPMAPTPYGPAMGMGPSYGPIAGPGGFNGAWQGALRGAMMGGMSGSWDDRWTFVAVELCIYRLSFEMMQFKSKINKKF
ncbi:hypothetical protein L596_027768 [Steinernema carpocapsae]|uniref:Uncharacterized protein n=1 Tax=Steinernema carpocapsae TaxID=34508 RepID=A0A4V5ZXV7_STECR|nr:hypothetical protein L596_027768 [Steinernema carpocapsae]